MYILKIDTFAKARLIIFLIPFCTKLYSEATDYRKIKLY